jgi:TonB family protein
MRRYLGLSIFLHAIILSIFLYRKITPLQLVDRSDSVSISVNEKTLIKLSSPITNSQVAQKTEPIEVAAGNTSSKATAPEAIDGAQITLKPQVMKQFKISYPKTAKDAGIDGAVKLSVLIGQLGEVNEVTVLDGPGFGLNEAAQEALKKFIFSPAEINGEKVPVRIVYVYRFKLDNH